MERLTNSNAEIKNLQVENEEYWLKVYFKLKEYEDAEEQLLESTGADLQSMIGEFMHYYNLQKEGRLVELSCKVGDMVYRINPYAKEAVNSMRVSKVVFAKSYSGYSSIEIHAIDTKDLGQYAFYAREINKAVFLTREEAEAALERMK